MKAMILAAGHGTRMRPLTNHTPKPLLKVAGKPLIVWHIEKLKQAGFDEIVINIAWLADQIPKALGDGSRWGVGIEYSNEENEGALETAGGIIKALPLLGSQPFLVVSGDVWCDVNYQLLNLTCDDLAQLVVVKNPEHNHGGDFVLSDGRLHRQGSKNCTFSGIACYHPKLFAGLSYGKRAIRYVLRDAMDNEKVSGIYHSGDWRDIGTPERLKQLDAELSTSKKNGQTTKTSQKNLIQFQ